MLIYKYIYNYTIVDYNVSDFLMLNGWIRLVLAF